MYLIDTHCHLNDVEAFPNVDEVVRDADDMDVKKLLVVGIDRETNAKAIDLAEKHETVYAIVGWHPNYAKTWDSKYLKNLEEYYNHPKVVAIGEIGLDYYWDYATKEEQEKCFRDQLVLARDIDAPVVFHCREALDALLSLLESEPIHPYLFHCFSGDASDANRALNLGAYFGVDGPITYKKNDDLREVIKSLPKDRIVLETDAPWLTPVPHRGKTNVPEYLVYINRELAKLWDCTEEESGRISTENALQFFPKLESSVGR